MLREHYARLLCWILATAPLWITGAVVEAESRLLWWAGAAVIDLVGTWLAHPVPGRALHSENVEFDADHMIERCRLFLLIALGESVLTSGTALAEAPRTLLTLVAGTGALATIIALWALHFAASGRLLDRYVQTTTDPILAARRTVNGLLVSVAGLIAVAVANELVITHPHGQTSVTLSLLLFGGPLLYLLSQTVYLWAVAGRRSLPRLAGIAALVVAGGLSYLLAAYAALGLVATLLLVVIVVREREQPQADSSPTGRRDRRADLPVRARPVTPTATVRRTAGHAIGRLVLSAEPLDVPAALFLHAVGGDVAPGVRA
jgi:low temperature requirement protein LtrA